MDRTLVSWNVPNLLTINLMAWLGFLAFIFIVQLVIKRSGSASSTPTTTSGGTAVADYIPDGLT